MSKSFMPVCVDRLVSQSDSSRAHLLAVTENPRNAESPLQAAGLEAKFWKCGRLLRIAFIGGSPSVQQKVEIYARQWLQYANLRFEFRHDHNLDAQIRISFKAGDSWSYVGTDALGVSNYRPTMNLSGLRANSEDKTYSARVLHEFGHALGLIHEHQSPVSGMQWNEEAVIKDLSGPPNNWDEQSIRENVLARYLFTQTQFTQFDPKSIMVYPIPKHWTLDGVEVPWNTELSEIDKAFIAQRYPQGVIEEAY